MNARFFCLCLYFTAFHIDAHKTTTNPNAPAPCKTAIQPRISVQKADPFDPIKTMSYGPYAGRVLNTTLKRPLQLLPRDRATYALYGADINKDILVANFVHDAGNGSTYWIAKIPQNSVKNAAWLKNAFYTKENPKDVDLEFAAHSQMLFELDPPIQLLVDQSKVQSDEVDHRRISDSRLASPHKVNKLVASYEAMYDFRDEPVPFFDPSLWFVRDTIPAVTRFISLDTREKELAKQFGGQANAQNSYNNYTLDPKVVDINRVFQSALTDSAQSGTEPVYHLFTNSCTTRTYSWLDAGLKSVPNDAKYFEYYSQPENLKPFLVKVFSSIDFILEKHSFENEPDIRNALVELKENGPDKTLAYYLKEQASKDKLRKLLNSTALKGIPSFVEQNLELRTETN